MSAGPWMANAVFDVRVRGRSVLFVGVGALFGREYGHTDIVDDGFGVNDADDHPVHGVRENNKRQIHVGQPSVFEW